MMEGIKTDQTSQTGLRKFSGQDINLTMSVKAKQENWSCSFEDHLGDEHRQSVVCDRDSQWGTGVIS